MTAPFLIWKHVPGYVNIQANQYGQIRDSGTHELARFSENNGYFAVWCKAVGEPKKSQYVHTLVMLAFKGERPVGNHIDHKDQDKLNNMVSNLHYVTRHQNMRNRKDQITVVYNGVDTVMIEALEDLFGKGVVSATNNTYGYKTYKRIAMMIRRGKTFEQAVESEVKKNGWPKPNVEV